MDAQLNYAPCGYFSISNTGLIQSVNQTLLNLLIYDRDELLDQHIESMMSVTNKLFFHTYFYPFIQMYGHVNEMYFSFRTSDQQDVPVLLNGIRQERNGEIFIDCVVMEMRKRIEYEKDILQTQTRLEELYKATNEANNKLEILHKEYEIKQQELISLNEQLETMASTDPLTGLKNRRFLQDSLLANIVLFQQTKAPFSLLMIDIDHFKCINDRYGHSVGDLVLSNLAQLLESLSQPFDIVARYGGEEFVIILPNTNHENAILAAEKYCSRTESAPWGEYKVTVSIGAATITHEDTDQMLLNKADQALYRSKSDGRNRITHSDNMKLPQV